MITTNVADAQGQVLVSAENAAGPWSAAVRIPEIEGIDPDIAWDADGRCLVTFASRGGIQQVEIDPETGDLLSPFRSLWSGTGGKFPKGPTSSSVANTGTSSSPKAAPNAVTR